MFTLGQQRAIAAALNTLVFRTQLPDTAGAAGAGAGAVPARRGGDLGRDYLMLQQAAPLLHRQAGSEPASVWAPAGGTPFRRAPPCCASQTASRGLGGSAAPTARAGVCRHRSCPGNARCTALHGMLPCRALYERDARRPFCPPALWLEPYRHLVSAGGGTTSQPVSGAAVVRALIAASDGEAGGSQQPGLPRAAGPATAVSSAGVAAASRPAAVAAILTAAPQCVPFEERVAVFRALIEQDQERWAGRLLKAGEGWCCWHAYLPPHMPPRCSLASQQSLLQLPSLPPLWGPSRLPHLAQELQPLLTAPCPPCPPPRPKGAGTTWRQSTAVHGPCPSPSGAGLCWKMRPRRQGAADPSTTTTTTTPHHHHPQPQSHNVDAPPRALSSSRWAARPAQPTSDVCWQFGGTWAMRCLTSRRPCRPPCPALQLGRLGGAAKARLSLTFFNQQGLQASPAGLSPPRRWLDCCAPWLRGLPCCAARAPPSPAFADACRIRASAPRESVPVSLRAPPAGGGHRHGRPDEGVP